MEVGEEVKATQSSNKYHLLTLSQMAAFNGDPRQPHQVAPNTSAPPRQCGGKTRAALTSIALTVTDDWASR